MKYVFLLLLLICLLPQQLLAQDQLLSYPPHRNCGTNEATEELIRQDPSYRQRLQQVWREAEHYLQQRPELRTKQGVVTIPVVFHVVWNTLRPQENISDAQILSQLQVMNEDFQRLNADSMNAPPAFRAVAGNARLEFCLAQVDPQGNPSTGITRTRTNHGPFKSSGNDIKFASRGGHDIWDRDQYLNIWVGNLDDNLLGYAQLPGGPAETDGVVLIYYSLGRPPFNPFLTPFNRGRTGTHEVGHWFGLHHIWGDNESGCHDSDGIQDTPNQDSANTVCPSGVKISCNNGPHGDMYQNYMDYTPDECMNLFTRGQVNLMSAMLNTFRRSFFNATACLDTLIADFAIIPPAVRAGDPVDFKDTSRGRRSIWNWNFEGGTPATSPQQNPSGIRFHTPGHYTVTLTVSDGTKTATKSQTIVVTGPEPQVYPNPATGIVSVELPADANVQVVDNMGQLLLNLDTKDRLIQFNIHAFAAGVYYVKVRTEGKTLMRRLLIVK